MAKILDNILPSPQKKLIRVRRDLQWVKTELAALPGQMQQKQQEKLDAYGNKLNKKLKKSAFDACDKAAYAASVAGEKLQRYDVKQYMKHREINHGGAKEIFQAIHGGKDWAPALEKQQQLMDGLRKKRQAYVEKLNGEAQAFANKYPASDPAPYEKLKQQLSEQYARQEQELGAKGAKTLADREAGLKAKVERLERKTAKLESVVGGKIDLPEDVLLRVEGLKMYFGGLKAVDDLTFDVKKGEIFGLIGPNGAGKTTVFNCITRFYNSTGGNMYFVNKNGLAVDLRQFAVHDIILQGISRTFQNVELVKEISVLENLLVACTREYRSGVAVHALGLPILKKEEQLLKEKAMRILKFMGLEGYTNWLAMGLPYGVLKKVEIARALMSDAKLVIMDEPAAGLNDTETAELAETICRIRDEFGVTILLVEHDMGLVMSVCDTICAISFGKMLAIGTSEEIKSNKAVQEAYLGVEDA